MFRFLWINHFHTYRKIKFIIFLMIAYNIKAQLKKFWIHYFNFSSNMLSHLAWCMGYHNLFTLYLKIIKFIYRRLYKIYIFLVHILFFYLLYIYISLLFYNNLKKNFIIYIFIYIKSKIKKKKINFLFYKINK